MTKISFLIPSKNRLELLKQAVASIADQGGMDYEIIISDNELAEDYRAYVESLGDKRIVYCRQEQPVSVTENWQRAALLATGNYLLMLGDDDALAPHFYATVRPYLQADGLDIVYLAAYHYCYPNVISDEPAGYLASVLNSEFFTGKQEPFALDLAYAHELAASVLGFHLRFGMNAQHFLLKTSFVRKFDATGGIYQSPYPDTFSAVAALIHAELILVLPTETVIIGISPKSFGAYYFSGRHDEGYRLLANEQVENEIRESLKTVILPGDKNNTDWLIAVECVRRAFPAKLTAPVNFARYRTLQMVGVLRDRLLDGRRDHLDELKTDLSPSEHLLFGLIEAALELAGSRKMVRQILDALSANLRQYEPARVTGCHIGEHSSIWDAYTALKNGPHPGANTMFANPYRYVRRLARSALANYPNVRSFYHGAVKRARAVRGLYRGDNPR